MRLRTFTILMALYGACGAAPGRAAVFSVNATLDAADALPGDGVCATASGVCTLRAAVDEANALSGNDTIVLPAGRMKLTLGELDVRDDATIAAATTNLTTVRGNRHSRLLHVELGAALSITGITLENGVAAFGGAILNDGSLAITDAVVARNRANSASGGLGAAIYNNGSLNMTRTTLKSNRASGCGCAFGGALFNNGDAVLSQATIARNSASGCGGGIFHNTGTLRITDTTIEFNNAGNSGGGLFHQDGVANVATSLFRRNRARKIGGGIFTYAELHVLSSTLSRNYSKVGGGLFTAITPTTDIDSVTIAFNHAGSGAGILNNGSATLHNSIVSANTPHNCSGNSVVSAGYNLSDDASCLLTASSDRNGIDPQLGSLKDNGGPTMTHALLPGSPAIDAGDTTHCPASDQRGVSRPVDGDGNGSAVCDIGAFEVAP